MNAIVENILMHYGVARRSGRYPWGSGENPYQHSGDFLSRVQELKNSGLSETDIAKSMGLTTTQLRTQMSLAKDERRSLQVATAKDLRAKGYSLNDIAKQMGFSNDSSVRSLLNEGSETRMNQATMKQAEEVILPIKTAITRARGPYYKFLTEGALPNTSGSKANRVKLAATKKGIENFLTGSLLEIRPMRIDKLQGLQIKVATVDEWLSGDIREDVIGAIEQGASKVNDYLIVAISSEGTVRNGAGDTIKMELMDILKGKYVNPHVSIWWYKLDSIDEVSNPDMWLKANPNLGKTVSYETYQLDVERAEKAPAARNDILAKRFGLPMEGYTYYFTYEETLPHRHRDYWQMPCALGADLSQGDDFCAFTFLFPLSDGSFGIKTRNYISSLTLMKLQAAMRIKYDQFMKEGSLIVLEGTVLNMMDVYEDLDNHIVERGYDVRCFGYDPYNAKEFVDRWANENGPFGIEKVIQGAKTESVPLGELKKLSEERMLLFDEELMTFAMGNCIALEDTNGNRKLLKKRYEQKIDAVAAMMDAYIAYKANLEAFE